MVDNAKPVVLRHDRDPDSQRHRVVWHPTYADFAAFYGFTPWAHWPYRPQTKGKTESGVKYVQRNALAGKRFRSWGHLNAWLLEWATTIADRRVHGTTHEVPQVRFAQGQLSPLGDRRVYARERVQHRLVASDSLVSIGGMPLLRAGALRGRVGGDPRTPGQLRDSAPGDRDRAPPGRGTPSGRHGARALRGALPPAGEGAERRQ